ncbi:aspartate aminotransferase family protein, partial [Streptomyces sp. NPDC059629]
MDLQHWLGRATDAIQEWADTFGPYRPHPSLDVTDDRFAPVFEEFTDRLKDNYPFFHPHYAGQMLKPPHPAAVVGHLTAMLINPNNHALDGGPAPAPRGSEGRARGAARVGVNH